jgi:hypothetical protein
MIIDVSKENIIPIFGVKNQAAKKPACSRWLGLYDGFLEA